MRDFKLLANRHFFLQFSRVAVFKQANAVQASATKVAAAAQLVLEGYSFLSQNSELIPSYAVNFDPQ